MTLRKFLDLYDSWYDRVVINDNNLNMIVEGVIANIMERTTEFRFDSSVNDYDVLFEMKVVAFGVYDEELCVRVRHGRKN